MLWTIQLSVCIVSNGCGGLLFNIRYFTEIMITIIVKMMFFGSSDILKHSYAYHAIYGLEHIDYKKNYETGGSLLIKML